MRAAWIVIVGTALPVVALGAETAGEHHGPNWGLLGVAIFNIVLLGAILVRFARRPIHDFLVQRSRRVARSIEAAESRLREAGEEVTRWRERLSRVDEEVAEILQLTGEGAETERSRRLDRARQTAERIRVEADALAGQELVRARQDLRAEVAALSASMAVSLVRETIGPDDDRRLVADYSQAIGEAT
jgi:F-type H+-transporting ATPase subunit b